MQAKPVTPKEIVKGDLPFTEILLCESFIDTLFDCSGICVKLQPVLRRLYNRLTKLKAEREEAERNLKRLESLIPRTHAAMRDVLEPERQRLALQLLHEPRLQLGPLKEAYNEALKTYQAYAKIYLLNQSSLEVQIERWKKKNELNAGDYTQAMKQAIQNFEKSHGRLKNPEELTTPSFQPVKHLMERQLEV